MQIIIWWNAYLRPFLQKNDHSNWTHGLFCKWVIVAVAQMCLISPNHTSSGIVDSLIQWNHCFVCQINPHKILLTAQQSKIDSYSDEWIQLCIIKSNWSALFHSSSFSSSGKERIIYFKLFVNLFFFCHFRNYDMKNYWESFNKVYHGCLVIIVIDPFGWIILSMEHKSSLYLVYQLQRNDYMYSSYNKFIWTICWHGNSHLQVMVYTLHSSSLGSCGRFEVNFIRKAFRSKMYCWFNLLIDNATIHILLWYHSLY